MKNRLWNIAGAALLLAFIGTAHAAVITSFEEDFTSGIGDWAITHEGGANTGTAGHSVGGGNPGGYLQVTLDNTGTIFPPPDVDLVSDATPSGGATDSFVLNNYVSVDFYADASHGAPSGLQFYFESVAGNVWRYDVSSQITLGGGVWDTISLSVGTTSTGWFLASGAGDWANDVANVTEYGFRLAYLQDDSQIYGFDNFERGYSFLVPEPETYAMIAIALLSVAYTFRQRIREYMDVALARIRA